MRNWRLSLIICVILTLGVLTGAIVSLLLRPALPEPRLHGTMFVSYAVHYRSFKEAYEKCDLAIVGKVLKQWHFNFIFEDKPANTSIGLVIPSSPHTYSEVEVELIIKGEVKSRTILVRQDGGIWPIIVRPKSEKFRPILVQCADDPLFEIGERVVLFLFLVGDRDEVAQNRRERRVLAEYETEYVYHGVFGRFRVEEDSVYSACYYLPEGRTGMLEGTDYRRVNGVPLEVFIETLRSSDE